MKKSILCIVNLTIITALVCVGCMDNGIDAKSSINSGQADKFLGVPLTIAFDADGGTVSPISAKTNKYRKLDSLPTPTKTGYTFSSWHTATTWDIRNGVVIGINGGEKVTENTVFNKDATIYARYTQNTFTVTFDANGGTVSPTSDTTGADGRLADLPTPTRDGYTFKGWWTVGGDTVTVDWVYSQNTTIYARWEAVPTQPTTYTLTMSVYPNNSGTTTPDSSQANIQAGQAVSISANPNSDYTFTNWTLVTGTATIANASSAATTVTLSSNATISANFQKNDTPPSGNTFTDARDGKNYKKVTIGTQTWMAENLNFDVLNTTSDVCYDNSDANCEKYGRLYNWSTAMGGKSSSSISPSGVQGVCPAGWHLPSDAEWTTLTDFVGSNAGTKLKSSQYWEYYGPSYTGTDDYGFGALPGGRRNSGGYFDGAGYYGIWWSATEGDADYAWSRYMYYDYEYVYWDYGIKTSLFSVRCVKDDN